MTVDEARRFSLNKRAREVLGEDDGATLMEVLSHAARDDAATANDLVAMRNELRDEIIALRIEMHDLFRRQTNRFTVVFAGALIGGMGFAAGIVRISI